MPEETISFTNQDQLRTLFGPRDQYLRLVRDAVGIDVVVRGEELRLRGDDDQLTRGREVIRELCRIIDRKRSLPESDVRRVLAVQNAGPDRIDLGDQVPGVEPRSAGQSQYIDAIRDKDLVFCSGPAGTGKTYLAVAMAIRSMRSEQVRKIVLARPAVEAGEKLGFLPGDMFAKVNPYLRPLLDALNDILNFEQVKRYMDHDVIEVVPMAFMRGRTLNDTFIILDEGQNTTVTQMKMFLTRMGHRSKIVVTGDTTQTDLPAHMNSGLTDAVARLHGIDGVGVVQLGRQDIVRHPLVKRVVQAYDQDEGSG